MAQSGSYLSLGYSKERWKPGAAAMRCVLMECAVLFVIFASNSVAAVLVCYYELGRDE